MAIKLPRGINLLWVLAALLGAAAIHGTYRAIHHPEPSAGIMNHFAGVAAGYASSVAEGRLQALARETFAPVDPAPAGSDAGDAVLGSLIRNAREADRCQCRRSMAAVEFFHVDLRARSVDARAPLAVGHPGSLPDSLLLQAASSPHADPTLGLSIFSDSAGSWAVLTSFQLDSAGAAVAGYGLVTDAVALTAQLFGPESAFDRSSLTVTTAAGAPLFHTAAPPGPYHNTIRPEGLLGDLAVTSALDAPVGMLLSLQAISRDQLWFSGLLLAATILVIVIAAISSRREALLARARSDFIAGVSHELRMPLAQILLASETLALEREPDAARQLGLATSIVREARRLAGLVDNVLLVARSGAVTLRPTLTAVDLESLFAEVEESVQLAVEDAGRHLEITAPAGLAVQGDRQLLRQALTNLIDNATKYGSAGQCIRLGAEAVNERIQLYVENHGPGIPAELRHKLFEPYERLPRDQASERTGFGLGLAVVAQIARACDGKVWLEDGRSGGARAVLSLAPAPGTAP